MTMESSSCSLQFLPLFLLILLPVVTKSTTFSITNRCSYTMWPAAVPGGGIQLHPGEWWILNVPDGTTGRVWARTACSFNSAGNGKCETGDCGGVLACSDYGMAPNTMAEFAIAQFNNMDFFDISLVDGFNVPMDFLPVPANGQGGEGCSKGPRCAANITSQCPSELKAPGGCNNACTVLKQDIYCCTGNSSTSCGPTNYSKVFKTICPDAYSYPKDDATSTFTCPTGTNYMVVFCPPINISALALPPDANPPAPVATQPPAANPTAPIPTERIQKHSSSFTGARVFAVILGSVGSLIVLAVFITFFAYKLRTRQHQEIEEADEEFGELLGTPTRFTFQQLHEATNQFRDKLGEGGFGSVFEGQYGEERIAVKRLDGADFGLCKLIDRDKSQVITRMRGTPGYLAPEWLTSQITEKADVYSFGVVVMEIISGRKNLDTSKSEESIHLITLLEEKVKSDQLVDLIDKNNADMQAHKQDVIQVMQLAMWCLQIDCKRRPQMSEVVKVLEGSMDAETNIDHSFVATSAARFGIAQNIGSSSSAHASDLSGPR
ncbi:unnamed protein product [Miscanthus lutarioriparius]|uniref:Protein kinase domain-containing protein n=1 Tax=Miscanthus lutarioriparius TaxID=422564 RepID=A0A811P4J7_9POAL|nr:unnamed protein product [Miscanthus lutarioriparius]